MSGYSRPRVHGGGGSSLYFMIVLLTLDSDLYLVKPRALEEGKI